MVSGPLPHVNIVGQGEHNSQEGESSSQAEQPVPQARLPKPTTLSPELLSPPSISDFPDEQLGTQANECMVR